MSDLVVYEWVNPSEFTPENGWVQDLIDSGRLRKIVLRETAAWLPTKQYEAFQVHNQMGEWVDDVTGTTVYVLVEEA